MENNINRGQIVWLPIDKLFPHPDNPRKELGDLTEIADSIRVRGVLQNLTVVPRVDVPADDALKQQEWTVVIGHRRRAAAELVGLKELPCVVSDMEPKEQFETMMIENVQRNALTVYEQAKGFQMMLEMGSSVEELAKKTGFSATTIRRRAQLAQLDEEKFKKTERRGASLEDYLKLSKIDNPQQRDKVLEKIGTAEFNNSYKKAMEEQKTQAYLQQLMEDVKQASWFEKREPGRSTEGYIYVRTYNQYYQHQLTEPEDADPGMYMAIVYDNQITLYRKSCKKKKATAEEKLQEKLQQDLHEVTEKLRQSRDRFYEMRLEFVKNFCEFNNSEMDIEAFAATVLEAGYSIYGSETLGELLGVETIQNKNTNRVRLKIKEFRSVLFK